MSRRDYAGQLVEMIRGQIRHTVIPVDGPGSTGALVLDTTADPDGPDLRDARGLPAGEHIRGDAGYDANGLPVIIQGRGSTSAQIIGPMKPQEFEARTAALIAVANVKAQVVQQRMAADLNEVEMVNEQAEQHNTKITPILEVAAARRRT